MNFKKNLFLLFFISFNAVIQYADCQNASIRGFVYQKKNGEPIIFTNVYLFKTSYGATTDANGYYTISKIPAGNYTLMVTFIGYDTLKIPVSLKPNDVITKNLTLSESAIQLNVVNITSESNISKTEIRTSVIKVSPKEIKQIPTIGGTPDFAQYLQVLPGVVFTGDQGGQLYIRGGSPIQNKVLLDGMVIYNPFHSIGLFSVFDTDIMRSADVFTGGFGAEYGGRISSIMDITTRDGNKKNISGKLGASTFGANLMLEGPIRKVKENSPNSISYIFSAKNSYLQESSKILYKYIDTSGLPFNFTDIYGKISLSADNGSKLNIFGFNFDDRVNGYKALSDFNWKSSGMGANFVVIPGSSPTLIEGIIAGSDYKISFTEGNNPPRTSKIGGFNAGLSVTYFMGKNEIKYGVEVLGFQTDFDFYNAFSRKIEQKDFTTEAAAYIKYKFSREKIKIEPSFRIHYYASLSEVSPEPRLAMKYLLTDKIRFKLAGGFYSQNFMSASSDRDVVNLFYGFLSGPENLPQEFDGKPVKSHLQKAYHIILGVEYDIIKNLSFNIEGYYKKFTQLTNLNRNKIYDDNPNNSQIQDILKKDFIIETGDAKGIDLTLKYDLLRFYFWGVYSLGYVNRYDGITHYVPHFERRHNVNIVSSFTFGQDLNWDFSTRWNFGSGFPFTQSQGYYERIIFDQGINTNITTTNGILALIYGDLNQGKLPYYHRLDFTLKRLFQLGGNSTLEASFSITNVYNRNNIFYFDRTKYERVDQLPVMPSLAINFTF
jgi:hypothetical protein